MRSTAQTGCLFPKLDSKKRTGGGNVDTFLVRPDASASNLDENKEPQDSSLDFHFIRLNRTFHLICIIFRQNPSTKPCKPNDPCAFPSSQSWYRS